MPEFIDVVKQNRIYHYPDKTEVQVNDVIKVCPSYKAPEKGWGGGHRLEDSSGHAHYIAPGWVHIDIWQPGNSEFKWTF